VCCVELAQEISEEKNFSMWPRDCSHGILVKNVTAFCPCLKSLSEAKIKRFILTALTKEVSKKHIRDLVLWFSLMKSILTEHSKLRKKKNIKCIVQVIVKGHGSETELNPVFKEIKRLRE